MMPNKPGYVYFIVNCDQRAVSDEGPALVKIGFSVDPDGRLAALRTTSPYDFDLLCAFAGTPAEERALQERFKDLRVKREWFYLQGELESFIEDICDAATILEMAFPDRDPPLKELMALPEPGRLFNALFRVPNPRAAVDTFAATYAPA